MKKLLSIILVLFVLSATLLCFASCKGNTGSGNGDDEGNEGPGAGSITGSDITGGSNGTGSSSSGSSDSKPNADESLISSDIDMTKLSLEKAGFTVKLIPTEHIDVPGAVSGLDAEKETATSNEMYSIIYFATDEEATAYYNASKDEIANLPSGVQTGVKGTAVWMYMAGSGLGNVEPEPGEGGSSTNKPSGDEESFISSDFDATKKALVAEGYTVIDMDISEMPFPGAIKAIYAEKSEDGCTEAYSVVLFGSVEDANSFYDFIQAMAGDGEMAGVIDTVVWTYDIEFDETDDSGDLGGDDSDTDSSTTKPDDGGNSGNTGDSGDIDDPDTNNSAEITKDQWIAMLEATNFEAYAPLYGFTVLFGDNAMFLPAQFMGMEMYIAEIDGVMWAIIYFEGEYVGAPADEETLPYTSFTLGSFILYDALTPNDYDNLTFDKKKGCYRIEATNSFDATATLEFYFENGVISKIVSIEDGEEDPMFFANVGTTVVELPEFTEMGGEPNEPDFPKDPDARTEITQEEWEQNLEMTNVTIDMGSTYYDLAENGYMLTSSTGSILLIFEDGTLYTYIIDPEGNYRLDEERYVGKYYMDAGTILFNGTVTVNDYYNLVYDEEEGCYTLGDHTFYFEDGVLVYLNGTTFYNHGEVVLEMPGSEGSDDDNSDSEVTVPIIGEEVTKEQWAAMLELDNFVATVGNVGDPDYVETICNGDVAHMTDRITNNIYFVQENGSTVTIMYIDGMGYVGMPSGTVTPLNVGSLILADCFTADSYDTIEFDEERGCYTGQLTAQDVVATYDIYFVDGQIATIVISDEGEMVYNFASIGDVAEIEVPSYTTFG